MASSGKGILEEVKAEVKQDKQKTKNQEKENNNMNITKSNWKETVKTIVITVLITAIGAFILGVNYERGNTSELKHQAKELATTVQTSKE